MATDEGFTETTGGMVALKPAVSWGAIWSGATVSVAVSIVLTLAGAGLGYSLSYSAMATRSSLAGFDPTVGAGAIVIQVLSAGLGGYLAGRLRTIWHGVHDDEAHFRDMAHGLIAWALATLIMVVLGAMILGPYADALAGHGRDEGAQKHAHGHEQRGLGRDIGHPLRLVRGQRNEHMHQSVTRRG